MILLSLSVEDDNDLFGYPGAGNSFLGGLAAGLHLTGDIVEGDLLPTIKDCDYSKTYLQQLYMLLYQHLL